MQVTTIVMAAGTHVFLKVSPNPASIMVADLLASFSWANSGACIGCLTRGAFYIHLCCPFA